MNQVAIVFGLIIATVVGAGAYNALSPLVNNVENQNMEAEVINIVNAASEYAWINRNAVGVGNNFAALVTNGYLDSERYNNGTDESIIETTITALPLAGIPIVTYDAGDPESCNWLLQRARNEFWQNVTDADADHRCAGGTLTVRIE